MLKGVQDKIRQFTSDWLNKIKPWLDSLIEKHNRAAIFGSGDVAPAKGTRGRAGSGHANAGNDKPIPKSEAEIIVREYIAKREKTGEKITSRQVSEDCHIAHGRVPQIPAWQAYRVRTKQSAQGARAKERRLTKKMLTVVGISDDPAANLMSNEERAWRYLLRAATP